MPLFTCALMIGSGSPFDVEGSGAGAFRAALNQRHYGVLMGISAPYWDAFLLADEGFVDFSGLKDSPYFFHTAPTP